MINNCSQMWIRRVGETEEERTEYNTPLQHSGLISKRQRKLTLFMVSGW